MSTPRTPHRRLRLRPTLMRGPDIAALQRVLGVTDDGIYGQQTRAALRDRIRDLGGSLRRFDRDGATCKMQRIVLGQQRRPKAWRKRARRRKATQPRIVRLNVTIRDLFGPLGPLTGTVGHYTAGPRDTSDRHALALWRQYHDQHARQGWGGIGYHLGITSKGTIVLLRPLAMKGAHVGGHNTGRIGIVVHGTTGHRATRAQQRALAWLMQHAHTSAMPASHRAPRPLGTLPVWLHRDLYPTACPGSFDRFYLSRGKDR